MRSHIVWPSVTLQAYVHVPHIPMCAPAVCTTDSVCQALPGGNNHSYCDRDVRAVVSKQYSCTDHGVCVCVCVAAGYVGFLCCRPMVAMLLVPCRVHDAHGWLSQQNMCMRKKNPSLISRLSEVVIDGPNFHAV